MTKGSLEYWYKPVNSTDSPKMVVAKVGDYILYEDNYHIVNDVYSNQYFVGKNPDYPNEKNPLNPGLANFGNNLSVICITNIVPADRVGISKERYNQ